MGNGQPDAIRSAECDERNRGAQDETLRRSSMPGAREIMKMSKIGTMREKEMVHYPLSYNICTVGKGAQDDTLRRSSMPGKRDFLL